MEIIKKESEVKQEVKQEVKKYKFNCKLCNTHYDIEKKWKKHVTTKKHLDNLNSMEITPFKFEIKKNKLDPYLNNEDVNKLQHQHIGDGVNINYNNNTNNIKSDVNYNFDFKQDNNTILKKGEITSNRDNIKNNEDDISSIKSEEEEDYEPNTEKQRQVMKFLIKNQNHEAIHTKLFQIIQKLSLDDLQDFSMNIINCQSINSIQKDKLIKVIKIYKDNLMKKMDKGEKYFNNNKIVDIIELLIL